MRASISDIFVCSTMPPADEKKTDERKIMRLVEIESGSMLSIQIELGKHVLRITHSERGYELQGFLTN